MLCRSWSGLYGRGPPEAARL